MLSDTKIVDYETFMTRRNIEGTEPAWLHNLNRGIFATPGLDDECTLSVTHTEGAADDYIAVFEELARDLTGSDQRHGLARRGANRAGRAVRTAGRCAWRLRPSVGRPTRRSSASWRQCSRCRQARSASWAGSAAGRRWSRLTRSTWGR